MQVTITTRHCSIPPTMREKALSRLDRLRRFHPKAAAAVVSFEADHGEKQVEARLRVRGAPSVIARGRGRTFVTALDQTVEKLERQLRRQRQRVRSRRAQPREVFLDAIPS